MITRKQKTKILEESLKNFDKSQVLIFTDFTGLKTKELNVLRNGLKKLGETNFKVLKKTIFSLLLQKRGFDFDEKKFIGQLGVVFSSKTIEEVAKIVYDFSSKNKNLKIVGGLVIKEKSFLDSEFVKLIGSLPSKEVLLSQFLVMLTMPLRKFLFILNERAKKVV